MNTLLQAAPYALNALGGIFGNKKKYLDPEMMRQKYGPHAVANDAQQLSNYIINSPYGQQLLSGAANAGQEMQTQMASNAASAGMGAGSGASSGASDFASAAAPQIQGNLERGVKADVWKTALPIAAQQNAGYAQLAEQNNAEQNAEPSTFSRIAGAAGSMAPTFQKQRTLPGESEKNGG